MKQFSPKRLAHVTFLDTLSVIEYALQHINVEARKASTVSIIS